MSFELVVFTNNADKLHEIRSILAGLSYDVLGYRDVCDDEVEVEEDGSTFEDNAIKKVLALPDRKNTLFLAEDSGLEVDALDGRPGVFSARYGGAISFREKCELILKELGSSKDRSARFKSVMALRFFDGRIVLCEGLVEGQISFDFRGENGFGYDPIFVPNGFSVTFGEMEDSVKHVLSHRGKSLEKLASVLKEH